MRTAALLQQLGTAHDHADLATRERLATRLDRLAAVAVARGVPHLVLATCNRHELYWRGPLPLEELTVALAEGTVRHRTGDAAVAHLVAVASGRASLVLGEPEVLGQVRRAWQRARRARHTDAALDTLMASTISAARRVRRAMASATPADTVAGVGARLALAAVTAPVPRVLILGAGEAARAAAHAIRAASPAARLTIMARRPDRSAALAADVGGGTGAWDDRVAAIGDADLVVAATGARTPVVTAATVRARRPGLVLLDLAVPRNIAPIVGAFDGVTVLDLDTIAADRAAMPRATAAWDAALAHELARRQPAPALDDLPGVLSDLHARGEAVAEADATALADALGLEAGEAREVVHQALRRAVRRALYPASRALRGDALAADRVGGAQGASPR